MVVVPILLFCMVILLCFELAARAPAPAVLRAGGCASDRRLESCQSTAQADHWVALPLRTGWPSGAHPAHAAITRVRADQSRARTPRGPPRGLSIFNMIRPGHLRYLKNCKNDLHETSGVAPSCENGEKSPTWRSDLTLGSGASRTYSQN